MLKLRRRVKYGDFLGGEGLPPLATDPLMRTPRRYQVSHYLISLAGRSEHCPDRIKTHCLEMQRLNLTSDWLGVYHRTYLDTSFDFQVFNAILNTIWQYSPPLCDIQRLYLSPDAIQAYRCWRELCKLGHSLRPQRTRFSEKRRGGCHLPFIAQARSRWERSSPTGSVLVFSF